MALLKSRGKLLHILSLFRLMFAVEFAMAMVIARVLTNVMNIRPVGIVGNESVLGAIVFFFIAVFFVFVGDIGFEIEELVARRFPGALSLWLYKAKALASLPRAIPILN
jgi:hypothetical protein